LITENLSTLKIHKLTQAQYDRELSAGNIDANALYLTPDEDVDLSGYATQEQVNTAIEALDADDLGIYVQSEEPIGAEDGSVWIDLNETFNDNTLATEEYVNTAIANHITDTELILHSASGKKFKLTIDDEGVLTATEIVESVM
jgi:hypothetical protein